MSEATFDRIATEYDESMPAHVIEHYLDKRVRLRASSTATRGDAASTSAAAPASSPSASPTRASG